MVHHYIQHAHPQSGAHYGVGKNMLGEVLVQLGGPTAGQDPMANEHEQIRAHAHT